MAYTDIDKSTDYFNTKLYTGTEVSGTSITDVSFQPDFVWIKSRSNSTDHTLFDSVRGTTKRLETNTTGSELTASQSLQSFDSDGFTLGDSLSVNIDDATYASWNWLADNTSGSSNTDGSITSTVSANTTSGFSIVSYTGTGSTATIGHGLSSTPQVVLIKCRSDATNWHMYHSSVTTADNQVMYLDLNYALSTLTTSSFDVSEFSSSVFGLNTNDAVNGSGRTYIAYCFAEKKGFSKFGSYTGNGNADGTFVYTGFKPAFVMVKSYTNGGRNWTIIDNKRNTFNPEDEWLYANASDSTFDASSYPTDFVSNGFKNRGTGSYFNASGENYIYMAFAENPFVTSTGIPTTAR